MVSLRSCIYLLLACLAAERLLLADQVELVARGGAIEETAEVVTFDGHRLSARWMIPTGAVRAVAVILQGSGNVSHTGDFSSPFLGAGFGGVVPAPSVQLAEVLASVGVASLRFSKRGVDDPGLLVQQTMDFLIKDANKAVDDAKLRFPDLKMGIVGFSEGATIGSLLAARRSIEFLYLFGLPTRHISQVINYQFIEWPVELIRSGLGASKAGEVSLSTSIAKSVKTLPLLGPGELSAFDSDHDGQLSLVRELIPSYVDLHARILKLLQGPQLSGWYQSMQNLPEFSTIASQVASRVYLYQGIEDAQVPWSWVVSDQTYFQNRGGLRLFPLLGHGFSPMEGTLGQIKTTGPIDESVLSAFQSDLRAELH